MNRPGARKINNTPAPGHRDAPSGALGGGGNGGYNWSSVSGTFGMHLDFGVTHLNPSCANCCAHGFLLRCLSE